MTSMLPQSFGDARKALFRELRVVDHSGTIEVDWSPRTLQVLLEEHLPGAEVLVVSNREPYIHNKADGKTVLQTPASGLVSALEPVMRACGGTWIAHGSGSADGKLPCEHGRIKGSARGSFVYARRIWLTEEEQDGYYFGFANEGLWPLCHHAFVRPTFREPDWNCYRAVNQRFADAVVREARKKTRLFWSRTITSPSSPISCGAVAQGDDPHLLAHSLAELRNLRHLPWKEEIIQGLLGTTILGFHTQWHCNNFLQTVERFIESRIDRENSAVKSSGRETMISAYPISIEWPPAALLGKIPSSNAAKAVRERSSLPPDVHLARGIERFDYTKGIPERLQAVDAFLTRFPEWKGRYALFQAAAPTRTKLPAYENLHREVVRLANEINEKHTANGFQPDSAVYSSSQPAGGLQAVSCRGQLPGDEFARWHKSRGQGICSRSR